MGTSISEEMRGKPQIPLSGNLTRDAWLALANAAQALTKLAQAALGENVSSPVVLSPQPPATPTLVSHGGTVAEAINDFLVAKARAGRSDRYLRALKNSLSKFCRGRSRQPLDRVTTEQIEIWLAESAWAPRTRKGYLLDVRTLYNFAVRRGYCAANPANAVECADCRHATPGIHTPEQVAAVLMIARETDRNVMRCLAVRYFAGLRASEAERLTEDCIKLDQGLIEVTADNSKTRRRRLVTITPGPQRLAGRWRIAAAPRCERANAAIGQGREREGRAVAPERATALVLQLSPWRPSRTRQRRP